MPFSAPLEVPAIIAVGVAIPKAQGQEITKTETKAVRANRKVAPWKKYQTKNEKTAITITAGTNQDTT